ncbi:uncharacterized protein LOC121908851 [Thunnus maccoyii]|uniref:uncharacterized protein LOC121908851 n=1 Tax=Thunnus maccoyii TaxID=8240 RepID=UPI001C4B3A60|nr:uncharacterized protein LOC121908851 [Thunnus maccoyii]
MLRRRAVQQRGCLVSSFYCSGRTLIIYCLFGFNNSKDMLLYLFMLLSHFIAMGSMNSIKPENTEERVAEGGNINLTCKYEGSIYNIQWYRQYQRSRPEFLLYITEGGSIYPTVSDFSAHINKTEKRVDLQISSAAVSDSAVYYCLTPVNNEENSLEGSTVTLSYKYSKPATGSNQFFWYRQYPGKQPEFLISHSGTGSLISDPVPRLSFNVNEDKTQMDLQISSAAVTDSALYYCAVRPTVTAKGHIIK